MEKSKTLQELNSLLDLAEKTSDKAIDYNNEAKNCITKILLVIFILFFTLVIYIYLYFDMKEEIQIITNIVLVITTIISSFFLFFQNRMIKELKRKSHIEKEILKELLSMIDDVRRIVYKDEVVSNIDRALIEMRLKRISFSAESN